MIDYINSLDRKGLIIIGRKVKAPGYLNDFSDPFVDEDKLKKLVIDNISDNSVKKKIRSKKSASPKKKVHNKKSAKRNNEPEEDFKLTNTKSYYSLPDGAKLIAIGDLHGDYVVTIKSLK